MVDIFAAWYNLNTGGNCGIFLVHMISLPDLLLPKRKHFGLSIGRTSLRAVEVDRNKQVRSLVEILPASGVLAEGGVVKPEVLAESLKQLLQKGKFSTPYVAVCFSEVHAYSREYTLPAIPEADIGEAVSWHVKDLFPFAENEVYFDWKLLETNGKEQRVVVVAVQKKVLDPLVTALNSVGLKPLSFEPGASAIARLLNRSLEQSLIVTEINRKGAYVSLVEGDKALFTTVVNFTVEDTPESFLKSIAQTITETVDFYKKKGVIKTQIEVILTGELATPQWQVALKGRIAYPTSVFQTPVGNPAFHKAYAAAVSDLPKPADANSINLMPTQLQRTYDTERNLLFYKTLLVRLCILTGILMVVSFGVFTTVAFRRQELEGRIKTLTAQAKQQTGNTQNLLLLNAQAKNIVFLAPLRQTPKNKLLVLQAITPESIKITQMEYDDRKLMYSLSGVAAKREDLLQYKNKLEDTEEFAKITLPLGSLETPENVSFTMTFLTKQ